MSDTQNEFPEFDYFYRRRNRPISKYIYPGSVGRYIRERGRAQNARTRYFPLFQIGNRVTPKRKVACIYSQPSRQSPAQLGKKLPTYSVLVEFFFSSEGFLGKGIVCWTELVAPLSQKAREIPYDPSQFFLQFVWLMAIVGRGVEKNVFLQMF